MNGRSVSRVRAVAAAVALAAVLPTAALLEAQTPEPAAEWRLETLDGRSVTLSELADGPVVVNAWATWCLPCVAELRSLESLAAAPEAAGVTFVVVSPEDRSVVKPWVSRRGYRLPFYVEGTRMPESFGLRALPTTWILDGEGRVVLRHRGAADWDRPDVRALLASLSDP